MAAALPVIGAIAVTALKGTALKLAGAVAVGFLSQKLAESEQRSQLRRLRAQGERFNVRTATEPIPAIYGYPKRLSGAVVFQAAHGTYEVPTLQDDTRLLSTVIVWGEGEVLGNGAIYVNDIVTSDDRFVVGGVNALYIRNYFGTDTQAADAELVAQCAAPNNSGLELFAGKWTTEHRLRGVAYSVITASYSPGLYGADGIPIFTSDMYGKLCYDPRSGTTGHTRVPALHALDYLRNTRYGAAIPDDEIDFDSFGAAATYCEVKDLTLGNRSRQYSCDLVVDPTDNWFDAMADILATCRGSLVYSGGKYRMLVDQPTPVTFALTEDNLTGEWSIQMDSLGGRVNRVTAEYLDEAQGSRPASVTVDDPAYRIADGGELLERTIQLDGVTGDGQALDLATLELRQSRYGLMVEVNAILEAMRCEVGDVVSLTHSVPGWVEKPFRVVRIALQNTDEVRLTLREYSDTVYSAQTDNADIPPGTTLANPLILPQVPFIINTERKWTDSEGTVQHDCLLRWNYHENYGARWFEIQWIKDSTSFPGGTVAVPATALIFSKTVSTDETFYVPATTQRSHVITGLQANSSYVVRMRARSSIGGASPWSLNWGITTLP